jgi:uncharacterized glyoxalase superfamily protein PhnB
VQHPDQPAFQLGLFAPGAPVHDECTAQMLRALTAKGAMPPLVLYVKDCRAAYAELKKKGVEFIPTPIDRYGSVDAGFRDPAGNGWKRIQQEVRA